LEQVSNSIGFRHSGAYDEAYDQFVHVARIKRTGDAYRVGWYIAGASEMLPQSLRSARRNAPTASPDWRSAVSYQRALVPAATSKSRPFTGCDQVFSASVRIALPGVPRVGGELKSEPTTRIEIAPTSRRLNMAVFESSHRLTS
jgi:hypothetical protein